MSARVVIRWWVWSLALAGCSSGGTECTTDADCPTGRYCRTTGECAYDCTFDADCPAGFSCTARGKCDRGCVPSNGGVETCDTKDNDCDGQTDEDLGQGDCMKENEFGRCAGVESCQSGVFRCSAATPVAEDCDGQDNDCDGATDEGLTTRDCPLTQGVCAGARQECLAGAWSACVYGAGYEEGAELTCDRLDNDCDGEADEGVTPLRSCETGELAHNGQDDNCNGMADEPGGCMVRVPYMDVLIDVYEATIFQNADCTGARYGGHALDYPAEWPPDSGSGTVTLYACSLPALHPSRGVTWYQAVRACFAAGKRLCQKGEWALTCGGDYVHLYPYGDEYNPTRCNTFTAGIADTAPTGFFPECVSDPGGYDMSGNLWEWTQNVCDYDPSKRDIQGGSYYCSIWEGTQQVPCDLGDPTHQEHIKFSHACGYEQDGWYCEDPLIQAWNFGFRCCLDIP
jgi:Cys-rich repeat protein